jgi:poly(3-hydroxybutyrate) depolymerase
MRKPRGRARHKTPSVARAPLSFAGPVFAPHTGEKRTRTMSRYLAVSTMIIALAALVFPDVKTPTETDAIILTQGLVVAFPEGSCRLVLPYDPVESRLITGRWSQPRAGDILSLASSSPSSAPSPPSSPTAKWEAVTANDKGWFEHKALSCGYAYLAYESPRDQVLLLEGFSHDFVYVNGEPRIGNRYGQSETYESWQPRFDYSVIPVRLKAGRNDFLFKCIRGRLKVRLRRPPKDVSFNTKDVTVPDLIVGETTATRAAIVVVNASRTALSNARISISGPGLSPREAPVPEIRPLTVRKIAFPLEGTAPSGPGEFPVEITLLKEEKGQTSVLDRATIPLRAVNFHDPHRRTYVSSVDGSVQHYAVLPALRSGRPAAIVLSLHGAGVEALNQVRSYAPKTWAHIVAPTNRRPYGFNWEDWGRLDALAVLAEAQKLYETDPSRVYLTGHSMGGHGAWMVGGLLPDRFGAIGPSAGWISFVSYKVRTPVDVNTPVGRMIMRAFLPSDPYALLRNYLQDGIYILHGEKDDDVPVTESREMAAALQKIHRDFVFHEQPGAGHWWDASPEAGVDCVDWPPLFDFFARHARPGEERVRDVEFATPCPGVSASSNWLTIEAQTRPLEMSSARLHASPADGLFSGTTQNVARLSIDLASWEPRETLQVDLDGQKIAGIPWPKGEPRLWLIQREGKWEVSDRPSPALKGPHRSGLFKDAFKNRVVLVFGTHGTPDENAWAEAKARYDAEIFWYQGNGSFDVIPDTEFAPARFPDRNVIVYGHADMNSAWRSLLGESSVQLRRGKMTVGGRALQGQDLGCLFIRPRPDSDLASVGAVAGTGVPGLRLTNNLPYLYPGYGFPDLLVARPNLLVEGIPGVEAAGFFGPDWRIETGDIAWKSGLRR